MSPAHPTRPVGVATAVLAVLLATLTGCGGGSDDPAAREPAQSAPSTASAAQRDAREAAGADSPPGGAKIVTRADDPAASIEVTTGGFSSDDTAVSVGDVVEITAGDDRDHSLVVGDLPAAPLAGGASYVRFTEAGTYLVTDVTTGRTTTVTAD